MKYEEINRRYTSTVAEYLMKGYIINTATMNGTQGEIAKTDLTDGKEIVRILLKRFCNYENEYDGIVLIVGKAPSKIKPNNHDSYDTVWNEHLEIIYREEFVAIDKEKGWYGTVEERMAIKSKRHDRFYAQKAEDYVTLSDKAKAIVLPFVRKQYRCKTAKLSDIESVIKQWIYSDKKKKYEYRYIVRAKGQRFILA
jgi:hypothetical protein